MIANLKKNKKKGFTLVELIVVIAIIAIIAAVAVPTTIKYVNEAKISTAYNEASSLLGSINTSMANLGMDGSLTSAKIESELTTLMPTPQHVTNVEISKVDTVYTITVYCTGVTGEAGEDNIITVGEVNCVGAKQDFNFEALGLTDDTADSIVGTYSVADSTWTKAD